MGNYSYQNTITDEQIKALPRAVFSGDIVLVDDFSGQNEAAHYLSQYKVIGVDTESRASFQKGVVNKVALLQLSAGSKAFLIRLNRVKLSRSILDLLESPDYYKIGVALHDDLKEIRSVTTFYPKGFIDLQKIIRDFGIEELSLKKMVAIILKKQISKAQRLSNWEASNLTESQQEYAATDAWVCEQIFYKLGLDNEPDKLIKADASPTVSKVRKVRKVPQQLVVVPLDVVIDSDAELTSKPKKVRKRNFKKKSGE